jgi:hypothetical protein
MASELRQVVLQRGRETPTIAGTCPASSWAELPDLFAWLHGKVEFPALAALGVEVGDDVS